MLGQAGSPRLLLLLCCLELATCVLPPFWPEDNCLNTLHATTDPLLDLGYGSAAINPFAGPFEAHTYLSGRMAGPLINSSAPCRLTARVGETVSFNVIAEDLDLGDVLRIYVLEDPGLPNGAEVHQDEYYQRCLPTTNVSVGNGGSLGPCPICQNSGEVSYGSPAVPITAPGVATTLNAYVLNISKPSIPVGNRVWCRLSSSGKAYGDGKAEPASEHGRLIMRKFVWTPLPAQGVCEDPVSCKYVVKFQAFDRYGTPSAVKTFEIGVHRALPQYAVGTIGRVLGAPTITYQDPVTGATSQASTTPFEPTENWMRDGRNYAAYVNCPLEISTGVAGGSYDVTVTHSSPTVPPGSTVEYRWQGAECVDMLPAGHEWRDRGHRTCHDYEALGWCHVGGVGPNWPGGSFSTHAQGGIVAADQACCVCGAGMRAECSSYTTMATCMPVSPTTYNPSNNTLFPRQQGCRWDTHSSSCYGQSKPWFVSRGTVAPQWSAAAAPTPGRRTVAVFRWTPLRGMEGQEYRVCFKGKDVHGMNELPEVCAHVAVKRCHYCARVGETFKYIAEMYNFDTNWLRLWNYNPGVADPDLILRNYLPVAIGSTYEVQAGDTMSQIAARLRTTVKKILEVNPDFTTTDLEVGQEMCVMPCTENPFKDTPLNPYVPGSIYGVPQPFLETLPRVSQDPSFVR